MFQKILIANRGEIAIRVMRAANELGKKTVAVYAEEDKLGLHRFKADEAYRIGEGLGPVAAYLSIPEIIRVAKESGADAIHPGYGLLSENPDFVDACVAAGITFIGPRADTMRALGDKASARRVAIEAGVPVIPATEVLGNDFDAIKAEAEAVGYPLMLKASWGGGGRGMRPINGPEELVDKVREGRREAEAAFGNGEGYLEKMILRARHVEVQLLGDTHGGLYHLYERDCTVQRRNQKVVERAPAPYLTDEQRAEVCELALKIGRAVGYQNAGTVEFLMDMDSQQFYFIEVNPRVQVEHTVTEEVTGIDIVQSQIRIAEGATLAEATGVPGQDRITLSGHALQCRVTTEDPLNNFIPDYGRITAYRSATGNGIRLDGGTAYSGGVITRYYDSLLVKVTAWAQTPEGAIRRMDRALREFRVRGVSTNIDFVINLLKHPTFLDDTYTTKFIDTTAELFHFDKRQDRATRILTYLADISVNGHPETAGRPTPPAQARLPVPPAPKAEPAPGTRQMLEERGAQAVADWMAAQARLLMTDTTMRDGHQSLLATRMRSIDMIRVAPSYAANLPQLFSVECWGGATFDVAYRFLQECPWQRLRDIRERMPNLMTQMLLRASNGVGYTNYPAMHPISARIGGILTACALLSTIPHEYGGGQGFAVVAAALLVAALALFSLTANLSRLAFVAVGIALVAWATATRADWVQATLTALTRGGFIIALFTALSALRSAAVGSQAILDCGRFLARQPPGRRYLALTLGGHLFGLILLYGSISLLGSLAAESTAREADPELRRHRLRRMLVAIQRGFASTICWSPMALSMAVTIPVVQGASWTGAVGLCLVSSTLMIGIGWLLDAVFKPQLSAPPPARGMKTDRWLLRLRPLLVLLAIVVGWVFALHLATGVAVTGAVMTVVPLVAMAWILIQPPAPSGRASTLAARIGQFATRDLAGYRGEIILLFMAGFIGSLGSWLLVPIMTAHGPDLSAVPPAVLLAALVWIIPLTGQIGMNPILSVSLLVPLLPAPAALGIHPAAMVVAITGGWAISGNTSPFTASVLLVGKLGGVEARHAGTRWNGLYAVATGAALTLWVLVTAALL